MSQFDFGTIDPFVVNGEQLADMLNDWRDAIHSMHRGGSVPSYVVPGMLWIDDSAGATDWLVNVYLGVTPGSIPLFHYNTTTGAIALAITAGNNVTAADFLASGTAPLVALTRTGNGADLKRWQFSVDGSTGALLLSSLTDAGAVQFTITFNRDGTVTSTALDIRFRVRATANDTLSGPNILNGFRSLATPVEDYDPASAWDNTNGVFVAPVAGTYNFYFTIFTNAPSGGTIVGAIIRHTNSSNVVQRDYGSYVSNFSTGVGETAQIAADIVMAAGDKILFLWVVNAAVTVTTAVVSGGVLTGASLVYATGRKLNFI